MNNRICRQWKRAWDRKARRGKHFNMSVFSFFRNEDGHYCFVFSCPWRNNNAVDYQYNI